MKKSKDGAKTMTGETRVSLVVGLLFIILFGLILSEITGGSGRGSSPEGVRGTVASEAAGRGGEFGPAAARGLEQSRLPGVSERPRRVPPPAEVPVLPPSLPRPPATEVAPARVEPVQVVQPSTKTHVVQSGETLSRIAAAYYGQANSARGVKLIMEANRDRVETAARLRINAELIIPPMK